MEQFRICPVCRQVPEHEVYQCSKGHLMCDLCSRKLSEKTCPQLQCKELVGLTNIRNRVAEVYLDSQEYHCEFQEKGCLRILKREEITRHKLYCSYNPDTASLCVQLGLGNCNLRLGRASRAEVALHFQQKHSCFFYLSSDLTLLFEWSSIMALLNKKRKADYQQNTNPVFFTSIVSPDDLETSTIFLLLGRLKQLTGFLEFYCFKVWESQFSPDTNYNAIFSFVRDDSSSISTPAEPEEYDPFPFCGSMRVGGFKDALSILKASTISFPMSSFIDKETNNDHLHVKITTEPLECSIISAISGIPPAGPETNPSSDPEPTSIPIITLS